MVKKLLPSIILLLILVAGVGYAYSQHFFQKQDDAAPAESKLLTLHTADLQQIDIHPPASAGDASGNAADAAHTAAETAAGANTTTNEQAEAADVTAASKSNDPTGNTENTTTKTATTSTTNATNSVTLVHKNNKWIITKPGAYPINEYMVGDWLNTLQSATVHGTVEQSPTDVKKYGMNPNQPDIVLTLSNGQKISLSFGSETPEPGYRYARMNDGPIIQIAEQTVTDLSGATAFHFIDTTPFGWDDQQLSKLSWSGSVPKSDWTLTHQLSSGGDPNQDKWSLNDHSITPSQASAITDAIKNIPTDEVPVAVSNIKGYKQVLTLKVQLMNNSGHDTGSGSLSSLEQYTGWQTQDDPNYMWIVEPTGKWAYRLPTDSISTVAKTATDVLNGKDS
ncbi:DUF4340 domain-containing protein [Paenibacillus campi]|uniref:DUF4340 domain-containing protein n=1 Tax=Paenibacillus campi TaxID=3106031 RepID=UPI002AFE3F4F|nr:DUF4340 domain-containing protein [Paenibacillus sp. SGZ-1014]